MKLLSVSTRKILAERAQIYSEADRMREWEVLGLLVAPTDRQPSQAVNVDRHGRIGYASTVRYSSKTLSELYLKLVEDLRPKAKKTVRADLERTARLIEADPTMLFDLLGKTSKLKIDLNETYDELSALVGAEQFDLRIDSLVKDRSFTQSEMIELATRFKFSFAASTSKKKIGEELKKFSRGVGTGRAKLKAMAGRSAA